MSFSYLVLWFEEKLLSMHNYRGAVPIEIKNVVALSIEGHLIACKKKQKLMHKLAFLMDVSFVEIEKQSK